MEFRGEDQNKVDQYSGTKEEEEEEGEEEEEEDKEQSEEEEVTVRHINRTTSSDHHHHHQQQQQQHQFPLPSPQGQAAVTMDYLSLGTSNSAWEGEREHMFDKVVTPSDVGKLNRLVIPKQHAEKYFPLDSNSTDKGLLLNFEDRTGKQWRFRYSYWNSSQSYVMTKGWSRFVKDKKLDAGDIVSFQRAPGRLFIDCRRRPNHPHHLFHYHHPIDHHRWGYSIPQAPIIPSPPLRRTLHQDTTFHHYINNNNMVHYPSYNHQYRHHDYVSPILIDSVPVTAMAAPPKRLRLFGVNMEYSPNQEVSSPSSSSSVQLYPHHHHHHHLHQVRIPNNSNPSTIFPLLPTTTTSTSGSSFPVEFSHKGKSSSNSLSFDLDP